MPSLVATTFAPIDIFHFLFINNGYFDKKRFLLRKCDQQKSI